MLKTRSLHPDFGVELPDLSIAALGAADFPEIRALFEEHSLLLFRDQEIDEATHRRFAESFGPLEDLRGAAMGTPVERPMVSNRAETKGALVADPEMRLLDLKANFLWHADSTFLPTPAISNVLVGYVIPPSEGGATEVVSTRAGWAKLPEELKARVRDKVFIHRFSHSRSLVDPRLGLLPQYTKYPDTHWRAVWTNPVNGREALLFGAHVAGVVGMSDAEGAALIEELMAALTVPEAIYSHRWRPGDVLVWDQRATLHRGTPWNYDEERTLASFVSSAVEADGISSVRVH
ncbi:MAG: TauD/TfdA family dioxygenase [Roseovarius sp.]